MSFSTQTVVIDDIPFHVERSGPKDRPLVVLSHALMATSAMWDSTVTALHAAGYSTLRYDHIGHGKTPPPEGGVPVSDAWHFDYFTTHIQTLIRTLSSTPSNPSPNPYAIIGCSMGGVLALRYALLYPGSASKIIACDMPGMTSLEAAKPKWRSRISQFRAEGVENLAVATVERWFPDPCPEGVKEEALTMTRQCSLTGYEICAEAIMNYDYEGELQNLKPDNQKVMVLVGENDEAVGPVEILRGVAAKVKGSEYVVVKDAGHLPPMHRREEFERIMLEFLKR